MQLIYYHVGIVRRHEPLIVPEVGLGIADDVIAMGERRVRCDLAPVGVPLVAAAAGAFYVELIEVSLLGARQEARPIALRILLKTILGHRPPLVNAVELAAKVHSGRPRCPCPERSAAADQSRSHRRVRSHSLL